MSNRIQEAVYAIPVPAGLSARVLAACRAPAAKEPVKVIRFVPAAVTAAACAVMLLVTLFSTGQMPGQPPAGPPGVPESYAPGGETEQSKSSTTTTAATEPGSHASTLCSRPTTAKGTEHTRPVDSLLRKIPGRFEALSQKELEVHYGRRFLPTRLPTDMVWQEIDIEYGVYYRDEAMIAEMTGTWNFMLKQGTIRDAEIIYDMNNYIWISTENSSRNLTVSVSTAPYPQHLLGDLSRFDEALTVAGVNVKLHHYDDSPYSDTWCHSALATVDGTEFYVSAWEFTREEFLDTLTSLLE